MHSLSDQQTQSDGPTVFGLRFSRSSEDELAAAIIHHPQVFDGPRLIVTANVDHIVQLRKTTPFRAAYDNAWAITADGFPIWAYARVIRRAVVHHVTGADLFAKVMTRVSPGEHRCFFIASSNETAAALQAWLAERGFPPDSIASVVPPFGFEADASYSAWLTHLIRSHGTTHLFMGLGAPKSEIWVHQHRSALGGCYALCVGAGLDYFAGTKRRAHPLIQRLALEWLWRLLQEPRRLAKRYIFDSWGLFAAIWDDVTGTSTRGRPARSPPQC